ncbi:hypothetical protein ACIHFD_22235 [Nonomuraea sp. NPDC051941]|uniref:hypothetical protein n=1 Tax=Nonomuraea sp. NPDC051941 TaxID=3364373 RepID=UPI0037CA69D1
MKHGINYDTGFLPGEQLSRKTFDVEAVRRDMRTIADDLHCSVVRVSGRDPERLSVAAGEAAAAGLEVWFAPFPVDLTPEETMDCLIECAERAEALRGNGAEVIFVAGCEMSAYCGGYLPGDTFLDRFEAMRGGPEFWASLGPIMQRLNGRLGEVAEAVRKRFGGRVTYASGQWELVDWSPFDLVGVGGYRAAYNAGRFREDLRRHFAHGKPVVVTEFGTCAYTGAGELGAMAWQPPNAAVRDEGEQVRYFTELLDLFHDEGIDTALWFTFAAFTLQGEQDLSSYGVVKMLDETRWTPKEIFHAMAARYARA